jgi:hypothetical protein
LTPPTISSSAITPLGIFDITTTSSSCVHCLPCALLYDCTFFVACGDDTLIVGVSWFPILYFSSGSSPCYVKVMACSSCCGPFPLDVSDSIRSTSSSSCSGFCVGSCSSFTYIMVLSYSGMWILSTSTTMGISFVPVCGTQVIFCVFR